jgi:hypothetical protein
MKLTDKNYKMSRVYKRILLGMKDQAAAKRIKKCFILADISSQRHEFTVLQKGTQ